MFQKHILDLLRKSPSMHYSELQPDGVESSHFKYHLNQLMKDKLVEQHSRGVYQLTEAGKSAVDILSSRMVVPQRTPKVITYTLLKDAKYYYLQRKLKEPYRDLLNMVGGKVHLDELSSDAAIREVLEKTGGKIVAPQLLAVAEIKTHRRAHLFTHVIAYLFEAKIDVKTQVFQNLITIKQSELVNRRDLAPDLLPILEKLGIPGSPAVFEVEVRFE